MTTYVFGIKGIVYVLFSIGHLHDGVILLLRPESFRLLLSCAFLRAFVIQTSLGLPNLNMKEKRNAFWSY